jgi:hypothetical protein
MSKPEWVWLMVWGALAVGTALNILLYMIINDI